MAGGSFEALKGGEDAVLQISDWIFLDPSR